VTGKLSHIIRFKKLLFQTWIIALILTLPLICFLPVEFNRFKLEIIHTGSTNEYPSEVYFDDLNSDGIKEKIVAFENSYNKLAFQVFDPNNEIYDQWNFSGQYHKFSSELCFEDGNNNGFLEVFGFTRKNDSVFLNCFEPFGPNSGKEEVIFVTKIMKRPSYPSDYHINNLSCKDINGDGQEEIVFMIHSGYSLEPRKIFIYDFQGNTLE